MKNTVASILSAITAGAVLALVLSFIPSEEPAVSAISLRPQAGGPAVIGIPARPANWLQQTMANAGAWLNAGRSTPKANGKVGLLLKESVIVLNSGGDFGAHLPAGTPVTLVRNDGRFLRVRHDSSLITIPRTSVISGVSRTN